MWFMRNKRKTKKQLKNPHRPSAVQCVYCDEWYTPWGPKDEYHTQKLCKVKK